MRFLNLTSIKQSRGLAIAAVAVVSALATGATYSTLYNLPSTGGSLAAYLVGAASTSAHRGTGGYGVATDGGSGFFSNNNSDSTEVIVRLANPTNVTLKALVAFYDKFDEPIGCVSQEINPNGYKEVYFVDEFGQSDNHHFSVKVLTLTLLGKVQAGVKGWLTHYVAETSEPCCGNTTQTRFLHMRDTELQEVPIQVARVGEADKIIAQCP